MLSHEEEGEPAECFICRGRICSGELIAQCQTCAAMIFHRKCAEQARKNPGYLKCACSRDLLLLDSNQTHVHGHIETVARLLMRIYPGITSFVFFVNVVVIYLLLFVYSIMYTGLMFCVIMAIPSIIADGALSYINGTAYFNISSLNNSMLH